MKDPAKTTENKRITSVLLTSMERSFQMICPQSPDKQQKQVVLFGTSFGERILICVEPWTFEQKLGEAVFIPAGCPHQVRNLKVKLEIKKMIVYAVDHAVKEFEALVRCS
ncbi:hypothetical protein JHK87_023595 [Glycine soja]|nr:hypothetical protein JHK87_023595 [Glycine soja]